MNTSKLSNYLASGLVTSMFVTVAVLFYFWFLEEPWLSYKNIPFPPGISSVMAGDVIPLSVVRCNSSNKTHNYESSHALMNVVTHEPVILDDVKVLAPPGCTNAISLINRVPKDAPPGRYVAFGTAEVHGTLRDFHIEWRSEEFNVTKYVAPSTTVIVQSPPEIIVKEKIVEKVVPKKK